MLMPHMDEIDAIFDATSADSHREHWIELEKLEKHIIDLTPSRIGAAFVPGVLDSSTQAGKPKKTFQWSRAADRLQLR